MDQKAWKNWLDEWRGDLLRGSQSDPLVHLDLSQKNILEFEEELFNGFEMPMNSALKGILDDFLKLKKKTGVHALCFVERSLVWIDGKSSRTSPISLRRVDPVQDKLLGKVSFQFEDESFFNPFLEKMLDGRYSESLEHLLSRNQLPSDWQIVEQKVLGNFHYHRYTLLKDFEAYSDSDFLNDSSLKFYLEPKLTPLEPVEQNIRNYIFPLDSDQNLVFNGILSGQNLVVEGPPGSGKSQVLANVLFAKAFRNDQAVLCSEKYTALEVVKSKLDARGLSKFCQVVEDNSKGQTQFLQNLRETWRFLEFETSKSKQSSKSEIPFFSKKSALELKLLRLTDLPKIPNNLSTLPTMLDRVPDFQTFRALEQKLRLLNERYEILNGKQLTRNSIYLLKPFLFQSEEMLSGLLRALEFQQTKLSGLKQKLKERIDLGTLQDLSELNRIALHTTLISKLAFFKKNELFNPLSRTFKNFKKLIDQFKELEREQDLLEQSENFKWNSNWSSAELATASEVFQNRSSWSAPFRSWKKKFILDYQPSVFSKNLALKAISSREKYNEILGKKGHIEKELLHYDIHDIKTDLPYILQLQQAIKNDYQGILATKEKFDDTAISLLEECASTIQDLNAWFRLHLNPDSEDLSETLVRLQEDASFLLAQRELISEILHIDPRWFAFMRKIGDFSKIEETVVGQELARFQYLNPELFSYRAEDFSQELNDLISLEDQWMEHCKNQFIQNRVNQFVLLHQILQQPSAKLDEEQKSFRKKLRAGRKILLREIEKSRQHLSLRELLESDAEPWVKLLCPILMVNPIAIAKAFPNVIGTIDLLLFDEASQIPFSHAVPAIFRSKQIAVFGDSQQLSPSTFFLSGDSQRINLLSESRRSLPFEGLFFHYRSKHPALIAYSNRYFYGNQLKVLPSKTNAEKDGVFCHYLDKATYSEGTNPKEAESLVDYLQAIFNTIQTNETIGICAFSEKQMRTIEVYLERNTKLADHFQSGRIQLSTLEQVQGDEFDVLLVSLGYGKDELGNFPLRFGPVNQSGGEKRLNVLFSRARRALHFFHSVVLEDFGFTENPGVQALKNFLLLHRASVSKNEKANEKHLLVDPFYEHQVADNLLVLRRHLDLSGMSINVQFTKDRLIN